MDASKISELIGNIESSPYKCILIDGNWGIGKTYEVIRGKEKNTRAKMVSLFGIKNSNELYQKLFWQIVSDRSGFRTAVKSLLVLSKGVTTYYGVDKIAEKVLEAMPKESELIEKYLENNKEKQVLIFDDIERIGPQFELHDFLGIVERLIQKESVKIVLVANTNAFNEKQKKIYDTYCEKVIDKIYNIDSFSDNIVWKNMGINADFIEQFVNEHGLTNLRTIKKANAFYLDVINKIKFQTTELFERTVQYICYSIVIESIDEIYLEKLKTESGKDLTLKNILIENPVYRIETNYFNGINYSESMVNEIYNYYNNSGTINEAVMEKSQEYLEKTGDKHNFYKSDKELREMIDSLLPMFRDSMEIGDTISKANTLAIWMGVLEMDIDELIKELNFKIRHQIQAEISKNGDVSVFYPDFHIELESVRNVVKDNLQLVPKLILENCTCKIKEAIMDGDYDCVGKYLLILEKNEYKCDDREVLKESLRQLLLDGFLPLGSVEELEVNCFRRFLMISKKYILEDLKDYYKNAINNHNEDKAFLHRMKIIGNQIFDTVE